MRKTIKVLSVLLAIVALSALMITAVSAAPTQTRAIGAKFITGVSSDFQNADFSIYGPTQTAVSGTGFVGQAGIGNRVGGLTVATNGLNKYMNYYHINHTSSSSYGSDTAGPGFYGAQLGGYKNGDHTNGIVYYDYVTLDFDLSADMYLDENKFLTEEETGELSYMPLSMSLFARFYAPGSGSATQAQNGAASPATLSIAKKTDGWYLQTSGATATYKLPDTVAEWTHITWVFEIDNSVTYKDGTKGDYDKSRVDEIASFHFSNSKAHIYINGEHLFTYDGIFSSVADSVSSFINTDTGVNSVGGFGLEQIRIQPNPYTHAECKKSDFSIGFDNFSVYYYADGYQGEIAEQLADDYTKPIYLCDDVVYSGAYQMPYPNEPLATITDAEGYTVPYYIIQGALDKLTAGSTIELHADSSYPYSAQFPFTIVHNGHSFALDASSGYIAGDHAEEGKYAIRKALTADYGDVIWDYKGDLYEITRCIGGQIPEYPYEVPGATQYGSRYKIFLGWSTDKNATEPSAIPAVEASEELFIYPVYEIVDVAYTITDNTTGQVVVYGGKADQLLSDYSRLGLKDAKIVLHSDISITERLSTYNFLITASRSLELDLNGYDIVQNVIGAIPEIFRFEGPGSVNVYSSKPGSDIISLSHKPADGAGVENCSGIVFINNTVKTGEVNVTIGNGTDNLTTHTTIFVQSYSGAPVNFNILGGSHRTPGANARGYISARGSGLVTFNAEDVDFLVKGHSLFYVENERCALVANFNNCLLAGSGIYMFNGTQGTYLNNARTIMKFTNTDIIVSNCNIKAGYPGCVVFGEGTRFNFEIPDNGYIVVAQGCEKVNYTGDAFDYTYNVWHPEINTDTNNLYFTTTEKTIPVQGSFLYEVVASAPVVEEPEVVEEETPAQVDEIVENVVQNDLVIQSNTASDEIVNSTVAEETVVTVVNTTVAEPEIAPTVAEIILSYVRSYMQFTALPVTKNSLFLI